MTIRLLGMWIVAGLFLFYAIVASHFVAGLLRWMAGVH